MKEAKARTSADYLFSYVPADILTGSCFEKHNIYDTLVLLFILTAY